MNPDGPARLDDAFAKVSGGLRKPQYEALKRLKNDLCRSLVHDLTEDPEEIAHKLQETCLWQRPRPWLPEFDFALATATGKTRLAQATIELLVRAGYSSTFLIVSHRSLLKNRWLDKMRSPPPGGPARRLLDEFGCVVVSTAGEAPDLDQRPLVVVQTIQAVGTSGGNWAQAPFGRLDLREELRSRGDLVVVFDESHHLARDDKAAWLDDLKDLSPHLLIGLTATPDGNRHVLYEYGLATLLHDKTYSKSVRFNFRSVADDGDSDAETRAITLGLGLLEKKKEALDALAEKNRSRIATGWRPVMLITTSGIDEAKRVGRALSEEHDLPDDAVFVVTSDRKDERDLEVLLDLDTLRPEVQVVVAAFMLDEGWDVTCVSVICPLRALHSPGNAKQILGRGLRLPAGRRLGDDQLDVLDVVTIGQQSLAEVRREIEADYGQAALLRESSDTSDGPGPVPGIEDEDEDEDEGSQEVVLDSTRLCVLELAVLVPAEFVIDWVSLDLSGISISGSVYRIDADTGVTGSVSAIGHGRTPRRPLWEQIHQQITLLSATESQRLATKVLEEVSEVDENTLLPPLFRRELQDEVERVSHYRWGNLPTGGRHPLVPSSVICYSRYELDDERTLDSGWTRPVECKRRWFTGFARSAQKYARFDSEPEFDTAKILDRDPRVDWWYRNDPASLVIESPDGQPRPDFVVGIGQKVWILEIKGEHLLADFNSRLGRRQSVQNWCTKQSTELARDIRYRVVPGLKIAVEMAAILDGRDG
jgi:superfamily II DNA or RNA helicase